MLRARRFSSADDGGLHSERGGSELRTARGLVSSDGGLRSGWRLAPYYDQTFRAAESIVFDEVLKALNADRIIPTSLICLLFHDCFVNVDLATPTMHANNLALADSHDIEQTDTVVTVREGDPRNTTSRVGGSTGAGAERAMAPDLEEVPPSP
ncbi:hypothetical protein GUJ93_ZPchr0010g9715 [Zizania palustris]|uniref:Plant heme peroxidase family profile domain-containing protein n=1 Tax=Zizania palustris TaxID=103762 RepID=A0A8J5TIF9_ZIZPA|nr:hypothetical protein GUJ93_ZPchr0010g9715 [Zizania palustris]